MTKESPLVSPPLKSVAEFPNFSSINHGDLLSLSLSSDTTTLTHSLHRFPAKYIPQVPRWAIQNFSTDESVVLDPFLGSGTSLVEGLCSVNHSIGVDIDPLARFISLAKTDIYDISRIKQLASQLLVEDTKRLVTPSVPMAGVKNFTHWFSEEAWTELTQIFNAIERIDCSESERRFFFCVFSSILRRVSNADDQSQKTYVSKTLKKTPPSVEKTFRTFLSRAISGISSLDQERQTRSAKILDGSATDLPLNKESVDLLVTSPPYLDSVDYMYNFMLEYFWLGPMLGTESRSDFNYQRRLSIGAKNPINKLDHLPSSIADLVKLEEVPPYRKEAVIAYFHLMQEHFYEAARVMKDGARYVLVVGNSQSVSGVLPVHDCLIRLANEAGLRLEKAFAYRIRRHYMKFPRKGRGGIILMDWVITLKKTRSLAILANDPLPIPNITIGLDEVAH